MSSLAAVWRGRRRGGLGPTPASLLAGGTFFWMLFQPCYRRFQPTLVHLVSCDLCGSRHQLGAGVSAGNGRRWLAGTRSTVSSSPRGGFHLRCFSHAAHRSACWVSDTVHRKSAGEGLCQRLREDSAAFPGRCNTYTSLRLLGAALIDFQAVTGKDLSSTGLTGRIQAVSLIAAAWTRASLSAAQTRTCKSISPNLHP